ncbi:hypothetical protein BJV78DRAFT_1351258 [Lactifluus subvellereus]|nr:hypothetical protein BJV78DRAFT_1351258 [Lactifluus subvellereus]
MSPRSSVTGELPIDSYFGLTSRTAGVSGNKENKSLKRKTRDDALTERASTKKQKTKTPPKGTNQKTQANLNFEKAEPARSEVISGAFGTASMPTPVSLAKLPPLRSLRMSAGVGVVATTSPSTSRTTLLSSAKDVGCSEGDALRVSALPTPQTVSYEQKKRPRTDAVSRPHAPESYSEVQSGPAIPSHLLQPPLTPSRTKTKSNYTTMAYRTTPHSQRIVPSSQWSMDEPVSASSITANAPDNDPFLLHTQEPDSDPRELTLLPLAPLARSPTISSLAPVKFGASTLPTFIGPGTRCLLSDHSSAGDFSNTKTGPPLLSSSPRSASLSSSGYGPRNRSQSSQIVPTSQLDEIELKFPSENLTVSPVRPPRRDHSEVERLDSGPLEDQNSHPEAIVSQQSSPDDHSYKLPLPPSSPLTPLTPSSSHSQLSDVMRQTVDTAGKDASPSQHTPDKTPESSPPSPIADPQWGGTSQHLSEADVPVEDPTSDEDENFLVRPSPARPQPLYDTPTTHLRISHAKLRSLPAPTVEFDSDGEEMPSSDGSFSLPTTSQGMSCAASDAGSYLDLVGTLPSEVGDFLDMVGTDASSDA